MSSALVLLLPTEPLRLRCDVYTFSDARGGKPGALWMARIKTNAYKARLKEALAENWEDYWE